MIPAIHSPQPTSTHYGDKVTFTRACPDCGEPADWTAVRSTRECGDGAAYQDSCPCAHTL